MGFGWQEIDKTLDLGYIRVAGLHRECKPAVLFDPPNFHPRTMTHIHMYAQKAQNQIESFTIRDEGNMLKKAPFMLCSCAQDSIPLCFQIYQLFLQNI